MHRFVFVLGCFVLALQTVSHARPTGWPANDQVPKSRKLLEVGDPPPNGKGFVWSQYLSISGAIPVHMRWSTSEAGPTTASWQVWAIVGFPANSATVVANGTVSAHQDSSSSPLINFCPRKRRPC